MVVKSVFSFGARKDSYFFSPDEIFASPLHFIRPSSICIGEIMMEVNLAGGGEPHLNEGLSPCIQQLEDFVGKIYIVEPEAYVI